MSSDEKHVRSIGINRWKRVIKKESKLIVVERVQHGS